MRKMVCRFGVVAALYTVIPSPAFAQIWKGCVTGSVKFLQRQGDFCPLGGPRNCTGVNYLSSEFNTIQPVKDIRIHVRDSANNVIGIGKTDANGIFLIPWSTNTPPGNNSYYRIWLNEGSAVTRWRVQTLTTGDIAYDVGNATLPSDNLQCAGLVYSFGEARFGEAPGPTQTWFNVYDGA